MTNEKALIAIAAMAPGATENTMTGIINPGVTHASTIKSRASSWL
jgi:hypothetical protein